MNVRALADEDRPWLRDLIAGAWGLPAVSISGPHDPTSYDGFVAATDGGDRVGVATYLITGDQCEVVTLNSLRPGEGIGQSLMAAIRDTASKAGVRRIWLITTNENIRALEFYQRFGMDLVALHRNFVAVVRTHKPGAATAPVRAGELSFRHALEFELLLQ
jgi:ribosomal protein S18 acetylase RimI-like enzyme